MLRVWWIRDVRDDGQFDLDWIGEATVGADGVVSLNGFDANEREGWSQRGLILNDGRYPAKLTDGELFLQALAWTFCNAHRVRVEPVGFTLMPRHVDVQAALKKKRGEAAEKPTFYLTGPRVGAPTPEDVSKFIEAITGKGLAEAELETLRARVKAKQAEIDAKAIEKRK
jgi:hypothetical protein